MNWQTFRSPTIGARAAANALFNQAFVSRVIPQNAKAMTYIDVHTESSGASSSEEGLVYRVFRNGAVDCGTPAVPTSRSTTDDFSFFAAMAVRFIKNGAARVESFEEVITPGVGPDKEVRTTEDIFNYMFKRLKEAHGFGFGEASVAMWSLTPNYLPRRCGSGLCPNAARHDSEFCDSHDR